jgi:hypothetical protein
MMVSYFFDGRGSENIFRILSLYIVGAAFTAGITRLIKNGEARSKNIVRLLNEMDNLTETNESH